MFLSSGPNILSGFYTFQNFIIKTYKSGENNQFFGSNWCFRNVKNEKTSQIFYLEDNRVWIVIKDRANSKVTTK